MNADPQAFGTSREWMSSQACSEFLDSCRRKIRFRAAGQGLHVPEESLEAGVLWSFLASRPDISKKIFSAMQQNGITQARHLLANYYILHLIDQRRSKQNSAYHSLYRRVRSVLSNSPGFTWHGSRQGSFYAWGQCQSDMQVLSGWFKQEKNYQALPDTRIDSSCKDREYIKAGAIFLVLRR